MNNNYTQINTDVIEKKVLKLQAMQNFKGLKKWSHRNTIKKSWRMCVCTFSRKVWSLDYNLYFMSRRNFFLQAISSLFSTPFGINPSITPRIPLPISFPIFDSATITFVAGPEFWWLTVPTAPLAIESGWDAYGRIKTGIQRLGDDRPCP